jgi:site-specific recombinase XerD
VESSLANAGLYHGTATRQGKRGTTTADGTTEGATQAKEAEAESGLVFTTHKRTALEPHNVVRHFKIVLKKAELPDTIRFHDLRHSCATLLIAQGVHPRVVMEILGHSQISTTMNTYGHVLPETQRKAVEGIDNLLGDDAE